jgi:hypothetical protein
MWHVQISLTTLLIVVVVAVAVLVAMYRKGSHSPPADHSNLPASPAHIPQKSNEVRLNRAYRCFAFLSTGSPFFFSTASRAKLVWSEPHLNHSEARRRKLLLKKQEGGAGFYNLTALDVLRFRQKLSGS